MTIKRGPGNPQGLTSSTNTYVLGELLGSVHLSSLSFSRGVIGTPSISREFFLDVDDGLGMVELLFEPANLMLELRDTRSQGIDRVCLPTPFLCAQSGQGALASLTTPPRQSRRVQPLSAQQRPELSGLGAGVGLLENGEFVLHRKTTAPRLVRNFGTRNRRRAARARAPRRRRRDFGGGPLASPCLATLGCAPLRPLLQNRHPCPLEGFPLFLHLPLPLCPQSLISPRPGVSSS